MHMCTHLPPDPKFVLALKITGQTYEDVYVPLASSKRGRTATFESFEGRIIIVGVDSEIPWGIMEEKTFNDLYEPMEGWSKTRFTLCRAIKEI